MELNKIVNADCREGMKKLPANSVDCCITSPPYYGLRDYQVKGQYGLEKSPEAFIKNMVHMSMQIPFLPFFTDVWVEVRDGNQAGQQLFSRHYSKYIYKDGRRPKLFVGPGSKMVLITQDGKALFVWRKFISGSGESGVNCAVFRNEGGQQSSMLILEAEKLAWQRWPGERLYTYVNAKMVRSVNPGYCFKKAGWKICGETKKRKLLIFEKVMP
jgi:hypothetical protein